MRRPRHDCRLGRLGVVTPRHAGSVALDAAAMDATGHRALAGGGALVAEAAARAVALAACGLAAVIFVVSDATAVRFGATSVEEASPGVGASFRVGYALAVAAEASSIHRTRGAVGAVAVSGDATPGGWAASTLGEAVCGDLAVGACRVAVAFGERALMVLGAASALNAMFRPGWPAFGDRTAAAAAVDHRTVAPASAALGHGAVALVDRDALPVDGAALSPFSAVCRVATIIAGGPAFAVDRRTAPVLAATPRREAVRPRRGAASTLHGRAPALVAARSGRRARGVVGRGALEVPTSPDPLEEGAEPVVPPSRLHDALSAVLAGALHGGQLDGGRARNVAASQSGHPGEGMRCDARDGGPRRTAATEPKQHGHHPDEQRRDSKQQSEMKQGHGRDDVNGRSSTRGGPVLRPFSSFSCSARWFRVRRLVGIMRRKPALQSPSRSATSASSWG